MTQTYWNKFYAGLKPDSQIPYERWLHNFLAPRFLGSELSQPECTSQGCSPKKLVTKNAPQALDLGCGAGLDSAELIKLGFDVLSVDISEQALLKAQALGHISNACVADAEAFALGVHQAQFDLILANLSLHYMPHENLRLTMRRLLQALTPGGQFIARFNHQSDVNFGADKADEQGYFRRIEEGEETLKVFYTFERLDKICAAVFCELEASTEDSWTYSIEESSCENFGRPKRLLSLLWEKKLG